MIRDITLGQYYPAKSVIHQLDPRVKLVATMLYIISLFVAKGILGYVIATIFSCICHSAHPRFHLSLLQKD